MTTIIYIVPFWIRFGSRISHHGSCSSEAVQGFLNCSEGTQLILLARSALEAAEKSCRLVSAGSPFRLFFVLNTDGEASDGVQAGSEFLSGYHRLRSQYPAMLEARSFVLGIGMWQRMVRRKYEYIWSVHCDRYMLRVNPLFLSAYLALTSLIIFSFLFFAYLF